MINTKTSLDIDAVADVSEACCQGCTDWDAIVAEVGRQLAEKIEALAVEDPQRPEIDMAFFRARDRVLEWTGADHD